MAEFNRLAIMMILRFNGEKKDVQVDGEAEIGKCTGGAQPCVSGADPLAAGCSSKSKGGEKEFYMKGDKKVPWAQLFAENRHQENCGALLVFDSGGDEALIEDKDLVDPEEKWKFFLVGFFAGKFPGKGALNAIVESWHVKAEIFHHKSGWIILRFFREEDMIQVLLSGPYHAFGRPLFLKRLPNIFQFNNEELSILPIWVQLENLPLEFWTLNAPGKICSVLARLVHADKLAANRESISFARALVEIDVAKELKSCVKIRLPDGRSFIQRVSYENVPKFCMSCNMLGHAVGNCKNKIEQEQKKGKKKKDPASMDGSLNVCLDSCKAVDDQMKAVVDGGKSTSAGDGPNNAGSKETKKTITTPSMQGVKENGKKLDTGKVSLPNSENHGVDVAERIKGTGHASLVTMENGWMVVQPVKSKIRNKGSRPP
ncbi:uncharacterized protein LOC131163711 [Malania oleifera]|uniref:uncharacterized protein LOC131163711 n=1 Tax=Malania oleifera TaxID=397392 RepID=UPI0025AEAEBF|nr:uncharacterized protein LOC131163711 [Malania oleifera]XP_057976388.1 uncharacterized protein LOC131163711 [Malania oleifera]